MGQNINADTAILIFSLSAKREAERKRLFGKDKRQASGKFFDVLIEQTRKIAMASGADVFFFDEGRQQGRTFGERYADAFQQVFNEGYTKVISIGNDTPDLTAAALSKAIDAIQHQDLVIGPATDGGVYLLGLDRSLFESGQFLALPWLTDSLFRTLCENDHWRQGGMYLLDALSDLDDTASVLEYVNRASDAFLIRCILQALAPSKPRVISRKFLLYSDILSSLLPLRAPPARFLRAA